MMKKRAVTDKANIPEELSECRKNIEKIDREIVSLLEDRMNNSIQIGRIKMKNDANVYDAEREKRVLENVKSAVINSEYENYITEIISFIIQKSRDIQESLYE
ncbi:chorismate mutase [Peptostreptococcus porci]|uniref:chorismate mutase n=1 Tax=Peptostreptococcus porci TaxID=2652282 RepID=UPI0023F50334|nr:chorismate mutase [Peptostreptococcus porci]MDD7182703.1 chorismate mutase [Peptostreptococcus porci]MDY4128153.1 chorismate mutase [Peptostreptococcus porci]MDY5963567.1 chorismate mutase [Peptostreptococcus porci]